MDEPVPVPTQPKPTEPVQTPVQLPEVAVETTTQSYDIKMPDGSTQKFTPEPGGPADVQAPVASPKPVPSNPAGVPAAPGKVTEPAPKKSAAEMMPPPIIIGPAPVQITGGAWEADLEQSAASTGVDANLMRQLALKESTNNPNARPGTSSAAGIFQITSGTWNDLRIRYPQLGLDNRMDPRQQARVAPYYMREIQENLQRVLGRKPNGTESYLGWFLGPTDAALAMKASPSTPVEAVLDAKSIAANPAVFSKVRTIGQLYQWSSGKMGEGDASHPKPAVDLFPYLNLGPNSQQEGRDAVDKLQWPLQSGLANMLADMPEELRKQIKINSAYRSPEQQAKIFQEAVAKYGSEEAARKWAAPPGKSKHNHGEAVDLGFGNDAVKQWVHANAAKYGLGFPMGHEPWHIEALGSRDAKYARMGITAGQASSVNYRVPFSAADDVAVHRKQQEDAYGLVQAGIASAQQDTMIGNLLNMNGKQVYDPGFSVTQQTLQRDDIKALPPSYLPYVSKALSDQDLEFRVKAAEKDAERERRLAATPYGGAVRMAVMMADPANLALSALAPVGFAAKAAQVGRLARIGAAAADGAIGSLASEVPAMMNKPGYEMEQAVWAGALGTAGYLSLNPHLWRGTHVEKEVQASITGLTKLKSDLESGTGFGGSSAGAAQVAFARDAIREDVNGLPTLEVNKTAAMGGLRFDFAKLKNSANSLLGKGADLLGMDTVGNADKTKAVTRPIEADARMLEQRPSVFMARAREDASEDFRKRNNISWREWNLGGWDHEFERQASAAVRNTDPTAVFDPAVKQYADAWTKTAAYWREHARNPGIIRGETVPGLPNADRWHDDPNWLPRYTHWDRFNQLNGEYGSKQMSRLFGEAIAGKNPDLPKDEAFKLGEFYYKRLAQVEAGQELTVQKALSGSDMDVFRRMLGEDGFSPEAIERALYQIDKNAESSGGKTMTSRQKPRTLMDENYSMEMSGSGGARQVSVGEIWEDNLRAISNAYNKQMSGAVAFANFRIKNPNFIPDKVVKTKVKERVAREVTEDRDLLPTKKVGDTPTAGSAFDLRLTDHGFWNLVPKVAVKEDEVNIHGINFNIDKSGIYIGGTGLAKEDRGKGLGLGMYKELARIADEYKLPIYSDGHTSADAQRIYRKLKESGHDVKQNKGELGDDGVFYGEDGSAYTITPKMKEQVTKTVHDDVEREIEEVIKGTPEYIVDGIRSDGDWQKYLAQIRAHDMEVRYGDKRSTVENEITQLQWMYDSIRGVPREGDRTKLGQSLRVVQNVNFIRLMSQAGFSSIAEFGNLISQVGWKHSLRAVPAYREMMEDIRLGRMDRGTLEDLEYIFLAGTDHIRSSGLSFTAPDVASQLNDGSKLSRRLDTAERVTKKLTQYTSNISLAPITALQERLAMQAVLSKFRGAALDGEKLTAQRMRLLGLSEEMQGRVLKEIAANDTHTVAEGGRKVRTLGLDKWDPQVRSAFEFAVNTWTRRIIQQNDLGQLNAMLTSPMAKMFTQFRTFTLGAWSKQTLSSIHMADTEATMGLVWSMMIGAMAYAVQSRINSFGLTGDDLKKFDEDRMTWEKIGLAGFQKAGASSLFPGVIDTVIGAAGGTPVFNGRATQQPSGGLLQNPTFGLLDNLYGASKATGKSLWGSDEYNSADSRTVMRALNPLYNYPGILQLSNAYSQVHPAK